MRAQNSLPTGPPYTTTALVLSSHFYHLGGYVPPPTLTRKVCLSGLNWKVVGTNISYCEVELTLLSVTRYIPLL